LSRHGVTEQSIAKAVHALIEVAEAKDGCFSGFAKATADVADHIAVSMGLPDGIRQVLRLGALLHDIGRIGLRDAVLEKTDALTPEEVEHIRSHVVLGEKILGHLFDNRDILALVRHHHEWWNGEGYPDHLCGEQIPVGARVLAVADAYVAMIGKRPHREPMTREEALEVIRGAAGSQFSPEVVEALCQTMAPTAEGEPADPTAEPSGADRASGGEPVKVIRNIERRLEGTIKLRAMPQVIADILAIRPTDDTPIEELADKIKLDPSLVTKLLGVANSAMYGGRTKVESIDRVVIRLGLARIRELAVASGLMDMWRETPGDSLLDRNALWAHCIATALIARNIAGECKLPDPDRVFTAGLIHDIGCLVFEEVLGRDYQDILLTVEREHGDLPRAERQRLSIDHAEAMRHVAKNWNLPATLSDLIAGHHDPWRELKRLDPDTLRPMVAIRTANVVANALGIGRSHPGSIEMIPPMLLSFIGLDATAMAAALQNIRHQVQTLAEAYGQPIEMPPENDSEPSSQRPLRYVREDAPDVDPMLYLFESENVDCQRVEEVSEALQADDETPCWVRIATPAFAESFLSQAKSLVGKSDDCRHGLLVLLPSGTRKTLLRQFQDADILYLVEPWPTSSLRQVIQTLPMRPAATAAAM
jgi:HD-GYP domain-containing protein (c-di-GMP phosphodiesterase class II)